VTDGQTTTTGLPKARLLFKYGRQQRSITGVSALFINGTLAENMAGKLSLMITLLLLNKPFMRQTDR